MAKYRRNAGIVVFRSDGKVLLCERLEDYPKRWQFPQGGIDENETPLAAAVRELREETSVVSVKLVCVLSEPLRYVFPEDVKIKLAQRGIYDDGQEQYWHLFFFEGEESEIDIATQHPEFRSFAWVDIEQAPERVVEFKRSNYEIVAQKFAKIIKQYLLEHK